MHSEAILVEILKEKKVMKGLFEDKNHMKFIHHYLYVRRILNIHR